MRGTLIICSLFFAGSIHSAYAHNVQTCENQPQSAILDRSTLSMSPQSAQEYNNWAFYVWSEAAQAWVIEEQGWDLFAEHEVRLSTDEHVSPETIRTGSAPTPPPLNPEPPVQPRGAGIMAGCGEPTDLPPVVTTGVRPAGAGGGSMIIFRNFAYRQSTGGGGFARKANTSVRRTQEVDCDSEAIDRQVAVLDALPNIPPRGVYLVRYKGDHYQLWAVTQPLFSDKGLQQASACVRGTQLR